MTVITQQEGGQIVGADIDLLWGGGEIHVDDVLQAIASVKTSVLEHISGREGGNIDKVVLRNLETKPALRVRAIGYFKC